MQVRGKLEPPPVRMRKNAPWGDRVVGLTDEGRNLIPIDPFTLDAAPDAGVVLRPAHVHDAFRRVAGLTDHTVARRFRLGAEWVDMFNDPSI